MLPRGDAKIARKLCQHLGVNTYTRQGTGNCARGLRFCCDATPSLNGSSHIKFRRGPKSEQDQPASDG